MQLIIKELKINILFQQYSIRINANKECKGEKEFADLPLDGCLIPAIRNKPFYAPNRSKQKARHEKRIRYIFCGLDALYTIAHS